jgi:hypothetical protein
VARSASVESIQNAKEFQQGKQKITELLAYLNEPSAESRLERIQEDYQDVLNAKLSQRENFQQKFKKWNAGFLGGSLLYGVSAVAKTAIAVAALAGAVAVAANPVGAGILLGVGIAGAVAVSVGYQQFYYRRRRQKRYDAYRTGGDPILDRDFLSRLERHYSNDVKHGFQIRAEYYDLIHTGDRKRQELLEKVAGEEQKKYKRIRYSTDKEYASGVRSAIARTNIPGFRSELTASLHARAATFKTFARTGDWQKAREKGREVRSERCEHLTSFRLESWLRKEQNFNFQIEFMQDELRRQLNYLNRKVDLRFDICGGKKSKSDPKLNQLIEKIDSGLQRDLQLREERDRLCKDLETVRDLAEVKKGSGSEPEPETEAGTRRNSVGQELERLRKQFVEVQGGKTSFAKHLLNGEERFRNGRGQLIALELDLAGQRPEVRSATDSPDQGVSEKGRRAAEVSTGSQPPPQSKHSEHLQQGGSNTITPITRESSGQETPPLQGPTALESVGGPPLPLPDSTNSNQPLPAAKVLEELNRRGSQDSRRRSQEEQARAGIGVG